MITRTWPYGTQKKVEVVDLQRSIALGMSYLALHEIDNPNEAHIIISDAKAWPDAQFGQLGIITFKEGGPTGGYWEYAPLEDTKGNAMGKTRHHMCISVDGVLAIHPSDFEQQFNGVVRDHTGKVMTTAEVRRHFEEAREKGYKKLPMNGECEGFSYETGCPGHVIKPKIYTASKVKHADKWKALRSGGYKIVSTWIDEAGEGETTDRADLATRCIQECKDADCILIYAEPGEYLKGAFIEIGATLAADREIYAVGPVLPETSVFRSHPRWHQHESIESALAAISERF